MFLKLFTFLGILTYTAAFSIDLLSKIRNGIETSFKNNNLPTLTIDSSPLSKVDNSDGENIDKYVEIITETIRVQLEGANPKMNCSNFSKKIEIGSSISVTIIPINITGINSIKSLQNSYARFIDDNLLSAKINFAFRELQFWYEVKAHVMWIDVDFTVKVHINNPQMFTYFTFNLENLQIKLTFLNFLNDPNMKIEITSKHIKFAEPVINYLLNLFQNYFKPAFMELITNNMEKQLEFYINKLQ